MSIGIRALLLAGIALCTMFTCGPWNVPIAAWIGMLLTLRYFRDTTTPVRDFVVLSLLTGAITAVLWQGAVPDIVTAPLPSAVLFLVMAPLGMLAYVLDRLVHRRAEPLRQEQTRRGATVLASLAFPLAMTAWDTLGTSSPDVGTFGSAGYSQAGATPVMQLAAVGGLALVTFTVAWTASLANLLWERRPERPVSALVSLGVVGAALVVGGVRSAGSADETVRVGGVSLGNDVLPAALAAYQADDGFDARVAEAHAYLIENAVRLAEDDVQVVVFSEAAGFGTATDIDLLRLDLGEVASTHGVWIALPTLVLGGEGPAVNQVEIIDPTGQVVLTHVKYGGNAFEGTLRGDQDIPFVDTPFGRLAAVICWDADFPGIVAQVGRDDVDLLLVPANDWAEVRAIHSDMSTFRAVENGTAVFRQTSSGVTLAVDAYGRVLDRVDSFSDASGAPGELIVDLPLHDPPVAFPTVQNLVGLISQVGTLGFIVWLVVARLRHGRTGRGSPSRDSARADGPELEPSGRRG
ncbi:apolipoprotein N-acyltransferase [Tessaracoccus bendigoensis DSM 12906]|uniref:Apolipoprotein N-acyltransferase n=1 Tax=Tessaracoccus bendigoensis DSM 12906 TaxID=1123357 RepID=A0A1M6JG38_9ACTN|nr:nitrilase-related carbon-nitrogen hydrolase [Tessaracoccus bendigoensis]SHJ45657.1 apolipoprotein N-acyltransferase [Tessaracoccus bendigoensis DSM 12906]